MIQKIKKRNGEVVDFNPDKIAVAIEKAFLAVRGSMVSGQVTAIKDKVVNEAARLFGERLPRVEDIQDLVEKEIMSTGFYDVAKAYILYRYEHHKQREAKQKQVIEKIASNDLTVIKNSGQPEKFERSKLRRAFAIAVRGYENIIDVDALTDLCATNLYDHIPTREISKAAIMTARSLMEQDPAYSHLAARLLRKKLYKEVIGADFDFNKLTEQYQAAFVRNIKQAVEINRLDPRILVFNLEELSKKLVIGRDDLFVYMGIQVLYDRYFMQNPLTKAVLETPQAFWMRIAMGLALNEKNKTESALKFYEVLSTLRFTPSTPTLFHAGTLHPQLSSCYLTTINDSLDHIFKCIADNAQLSKWSGGLGNDWTNLRGMGSLIKGTGVESQGVIPFLKIANDTTVAINRSGRRRGATCAYLETWHYDIEDFLELRKNTGDERRRTHDMNTANWIPDLFMKRIKEDGDWTLFSPDETPDLHHLYGKKFEERYVHYEKLAAAGKVRLFKKIKARELWRKMLSMLFETGHPWVTFKDPSNIRSPQDHTGVVHSSNLCVEITLNTSTEETAVCNLGSVNLARHFAPSSGQLDLALLKDTVTTAMRMLDNVIDLNFYPTAEAKTSNLRHRPVGLGIMAFQDALYLQNINFDSEACVKFADESMEAISYFAILASTELAAERGAYPSFKGSKWDRDILPVDTLDLLEQERGLPIDVPRTGQLDWSVVREAIKIHGLRNSNCLAMAPTATISNIAGCTPTIEPIYKNIYTKSNQAGDFVVINSYLVEDLKKIGLWDQEMLAKIKFHDGSIALIKEIPEQLRNKYKEVFEIDPKWLIKAAAYRGKWIDQSQSLNIFYRGSSGKQINEIYMFAWEMGLKTTYYLRTLAASQVEKSTVNASEFGSTHTRPEHLATKFDPPAGGQNLNELAKPDLVPASAPARSPVLAQAQPFGQQTQRAAQAAVAGNGAGQAPPHFSRGADDIRQRQPLGGFASNDQISDGLAGNGAGQAFGGEHQESPFMSIKTVLKNTQINPRPYSDSAPQSGVKTMETNQLGVEVKLCQIDDPACEACQ